MSRWTYRTATVEVRGNKQDVRELTQKERLEFAQASKKIHAGEMQGAELPPLVIKFGAINPVLTGEEIEAMPGDLADECVAKIMELSGMGKDAQPAEDDEKKDS